MGGYIKKSLHLYMIFLKKGPLCRGKKPIKNPQTPDENGNEDDNEAAAEEEAERARNVSEQDDKIMEMHNEFLSL